MVEDRPRLEDRSRAEDRSRLAQASAVAATAQVNVAGYVRALRRFWWIVAVGLVVAVVAALSARFTIGLFPPDLDTKDAVTYTAESRLLITSADNPHFRSKETVQVPATTSGGDTTDGGESADGENTVPFSSAPDLNTIVRNANTYPYIIESDEVADYRRREFGDLPGSVDALGATSVVTANRVELSEIPVIRLIAVADSPEDAVSLADKTGKAFIGWLEDFQVDNKIPQTDRIVVEQLTAPHGAVASDGPSTTLPLLVFVFVFAAFCVLAVLVDRFMPPSAPRPAVEPVEPVQVKKTA